MDETGMPLLGSSATPSGNIPTFILGTKYELKKPTRRS
jgi:hypothetical protein